MEELIKGAIAKFNEQSERDEKIQDSIKGLKRTVQIALADGKTYNFTLEDNKLGDLCEGSIENANIKVTTDRETLEGLLKREINPLKAYANQKIKVQASFTDLLMFKKFF